MKNSFLLYALILSMIMNVFMYMYFSKQTDFEKQQHIKTKSKLETSEQKIASANYFSLAYNENAQNYFDNDNVKVPLDYQKLIPLVTEKLKSFNDDPKGNKYIDQDKIGEQKFIINKAHILNHRWIIADFSDGNYWGECLIKYFVDDNENVEFETLTTLLYQK
jgi:hypothetical protein